MTPPPWFDPRLLDPSALERVRSAFAAGSPFPHVFLDAPLAAAAAEALHAAVERAAFARHHHAPYRIWVARRELQAASSLTEFVDWLRTPDAAAFHFGHAGVSGPAGPLKVQVQVARGLAGDYFPVHIDTDAEGVAVVYNLTKGWRPELGGSLEFVEPTRGDVVLSIPPRFNSAILFRPANAPHRVAPVAPDAGDARRYTVTAFYVDAASA